MIALRENLPLLRVGEYDLVCYDREWISRQLRTTAQAVGHPDWSPAEAVAAGVLSYLRHRCPATTVTLAFVHRMLSISLGRVGHGDIAAALHLHPPEVTLDFGELARQSGSLPLFFFPLLQRRLASLHGAGVREIRLAGVRTACLALAGTRKWSARSALVQSEALAAVQQEVPLVAVAVDSPKF